MFFAVCIIAQVIGAYFGPRYVVKFSEKVIRTVIGFGLIIATLFILAGKFHLIPSGGTAIGLTHFKLVIAAVALFVFGALNNIGIGCFGPTIATVYALGMSPAAAFPIMMGSTALSVPVGSMQFIKYQKYDRKITLFTSTVGLLGVFLGVYFIHALDISKLQWVVAFVLLYGGLNMIVNEFKPVQRIHL